MTEKTFDVVNPYTGKVVGSVPIATTEQIETAMRLAYETKVALTAEKRAGILERTAIALKENKRELARLITSESGLCLKDTLHEVDRAADVAVFSAKVAMDIDKDTTTKYLFNSQSGSPRFNVITEPMDLVVAITPFNHPLNQAAHKIFPAVAAGTRMVLKPSEKTPLSAIRLGELLLEAGLEENMLNIITGVPAEEIVGRLVSSPLVDMVAFTGGLGVGLSIMKKMFDSGNALKRYVPELGGCSSLIVHEDADMEKAVKMAVNGCFKNSGQRCTAIRRVIVNETIANEFVDMVVNETEKIKCGDPCDIETDMGTVISEGAAKIIEKRVEMAIEDGAKLKIGNVRRGALYFPTVLDKVNVESELVSKETFGPVCPVMRVKNIDEAIALAKKTNYRLAGAVMTKSGNIAKKVANSLIVGQFNWNGVPGYRTEAAPFGGFGDSGNGEKEGVVLAAEGMRRIRTFYEH